MFGVKEGIGEGGKCAIGYKSVPCSSYKKI